MGLPLIRPMRPDDVPAAERLSAESFLDLDLRTAPAGAPVPTLRAPARADVWVARTRHLVTTDPGGCWVAEDETGIVGLATSLVRETTWILAGYAVRPDRQGDGIGRQLLAAALHHGRACLHGMLAASADPAALRHYRAAGFAFQPQMHLTGTVDRSAIPVVTKVREGTAADTELMDSVDRRTRGAGHGPDHPFMQSHLAAAGLRHHHRVGLRLRRARRPARAAGRHQPAYGDPVAVGGARRRPLRSRPCATSPRPTPGRSRSR